jgi:hypothetical protein
MGTWQPDGRVPGCEDDANFKGDVNLKRVPDINSTCACALECMRYTSPEDKPACNVW